MMQTFRGIKVLTAGGLLVSFSVATLAFAGTASAVTPLSTVTCSHLAGSAISSTATLTDCSAHTGGSGTISRFGYTNSKVTWSNGTKTRYKVTSHTTGGTKCPSNTTEINVKGTVSSSTNTAIPVGAVVKMTLCLHNSGTVKNASGTVVQF